MNVSRALPALLLVLLGPRLGAAAAAPRVVCHDDGRCSVSALPPALRDAEVLDHLKSGLTTTLVISLSVRGERGEKLGARDRIDVRFEPWEETFDVAVAVPGTPVARRRLASETHLHAWWRDLTLSFALDAAARGSARVSVELIPFSEEEQSDARRWYAETLRVGPGGPGGSAGDAGSSAIGGVLDSLTLTSIKRQGVLRLAWTSTVERVR